MRKFSKAFLGVVFTSLLLCSCSLLSNNNTNNKNNKLPLSEIANTVANVFNSNSIGIAQKTNRRASYNLNPHYKQSSQEEIEYEKNYLVVSSESHYEEGSSAEFDENGLSKVTFTRITTEEISEETEGNKEYVSFKGEISFKFVETLNYSLFDGETLLYDDIKDNEFPDINPTVGIVTIGELGHKKSYQLKYNGYFKEEIVTQDEIDGQVDKVYVLGDFTFISFVASNSNGSFGGYQQDSDYNTYGYITQTGRASFVIDNNTGYVYDLKDFPVSHIKNSLCFGSDDAAYDLKVGDNNELVFTRVVKNQTLEAYDVFKDKYGNLYVYNNDLDTFDEANKTVYFSKLNYFLASDQTAIYFDYSAENSVSAHRVWQDKVPSNCTDIKKMGPNFEKQAISREEKYEINYIPFYRGNQSASSCLISNIENGYLYMRALQTYAYCELYRYSVSDFQRSSSGYGICGDGAWVERSVLSCPIDHHRVLLLTTPDLGGKLLYGDVFENGIFVAPAGYIANNQPYREENANCLLEDCKLDDYSLYGWDYDLSHMVFKKVGIEGTNYYRVIVDKDDNVVVVNTSTYISSEHEDTVILQPINR